MLFSIIIAAYNVEKTISKCILSVVSQTYRDIEIIVVDDGSTDNTGRICDYCANKDYRIKVIHKKNGGLSDARNSGISLASGNYLMFVDGDDYISKTACAELSKMIENTNADVIIGDYYSEFSECILRHKNSSLMIGKIMTGKEYLRDSLKNGEFCAPAPFSIYKTDYWKENEFVFKKGIYHEDMQLALHIFMRATRVVYSGIPYYCMVFRKTSIMNSDTNKDKRYKDIRDIFSEWLTIAANQEDIRLKKGIIGSTCKFYLNVLARNRVLHPDFSVITRRMMIEYALNAKELIKVFLFILFPSFYCFIWHKAHDKHLV